MTPTGAQIRLPRRPQRNGDTWPTHRGKRRKQRRRTHAIVIETRAQQWWEIDPYATKSLPHRADRSTP